MDKNSGKTENTDQHKTPKTEKKQSCLRLYSGSNEFKFENGS